MINHNVSLRSLALSAAILGLAACETSEPPRTASATLAIAPAPASQSSYAVLAANSAQISDRAVIAGHVGVIASSATTLGQTMADGVRLSVGTFADVGATSRSELYAHTTLFRYGSDVYAAHVGPQPVLDQHRSGIIGPNMFGAMPLFPRARGVVPGVTELFVTEGSTTSIELASTTYRSLHVAAGAVLRISAGSYELESVVLEDRARIIALGTVELRIAGRFTAGERARLIAAAGDTARSLRIEALGQNGGARLPGSLPRAIALGASSVAQAILFAPNGTLGIGDGAALTGAAVARDVFVGSNAHLIRQDGLLPLAGSTPLAYADHYQATEDEPLAITPEGVLANDLQPNYAPLTATLVSATHSGTIALSADGGFIYTPNVNFEGDDSFTYQANNASATSAITTVNIHVDGTNDVPVFHSIPDTTAFVGEQWRYSMFCDDPDLGDVLSYSRSNAPAGMTQTGDELAWTPSSSQLGTIELDVSCTDSHAAADEQHIRVTVQAAPPVESFVVYASNSVYFRGIAVDGSVGSRATGPGAVLQEGRTSIDGDAIVGELPGAGVFGDTVRLGGTSVVRDVYTNSLLLDRPGHRGALAAMPAMPALPTTSAVNAGTGTLIVSTSGTISSTKSWAAYDVRSNACLYLLPGVHHVGSITVATHGCIAALGPVELRVAGRVYLDEYGYIGPAAGSSFGPESVRLEVNGTNLVMGNATSKPVAMETFRQSSVQAVVVVPNGTLMFGFRSVNFGGFYAKDIWVRDEAVFFSGAAPAPNQPPSIVSTPAGSVLEGATFTYQVEVADDPEDVEQFVLDQRPTGMTIGASSGLVTWTPGQADVGVHTVRIRVTDAGGLSDTQQFTLTVVNVSNAPVFTTAPITSVDEDALYAYSAGAEDSDGDTFSISLVQGPAGMSLEAGSVLTWSPVQSDVGSHNVVLAVTDGHLSTTQTFQLTVLEVNEQPVFDNVPSGTATQGQLFSTVVHAVDPDPEDSLTYSLSSSPSGMTIDAVSGAISWTPGSAHVGPQIIEVQARDEAGLIGSAELTVTVSDVNDPPQFGEVPSPAATENQLFSYSVSATDPDSGDSITYSLVLMPEGMTISGSGLSWTPSDDQVGSFPVTVRAEDSHGAFALQSFNVEVENVNDRPVIDSSEVTTAQEGQLYRYAVSAHDVDRSDTLTYDVAGPSGMEISPSTGVLTWTPAFAQVGSHSVVITVDDGTHASDGTATQSFSLTVANVNDAPVIVPEAPETAQQHQGYVYQAQVLDDSTVLDFDLDVAPQGMTVDALGVIRWTPSDAQVGLYGVVLRVTDEGGLFDLYSFSVEVIEVNDPPSFVTTAPLAGVENVQYAYDARATDPEGHTLVYTLLQGPAALTVNSFTGRVRWIPRGADAGAHLVRLRVVDQLGEAAEQSFTITVTGAPCTVADESARCSALAWTHVLGKDGVPLGTVTIEQLGPDTRTTSSDPETGLATLGGGPEGRYDWSFSSPGFVTVHASAELESRSLVHVAVPRMAPLTDAVVTLPVQGTSAEDVNGEVSLVFGSGSVTTEALLSVAVLDGQSLPAYLPSGWSPVAAVAFEVTQPVLAPPTASFALPAPLPANSTLILARFDEQSVEWIAVRDVPAVGLRAQTILGGEGAYALVVADQGSDAPTYPGAGAALQAGTASPPALSSLEASGAVIPAWQVASEDLDEITGVGRVQLASSASFPSGIVLPARLFERYAFAGGRSADVPFIDMGVALYRYPPRVEAAPGTLSAAFTVRPQKLFPLNARTDTHQEIVFSSALDRLSSPLDGNGGLVSTDHLTLTIPPGTFVGPTLVSLAEIDAAAIELEGVVPVLAFRATWSGNNTPIGTRLELSASVPPNRNYVLARRELGDGWTPIERFHSDASGVLESLEPAPPAVALSGISAGGTFALFAIGVAEGIVHGIVERASDGSAVANALVSIADRPWVQRTGGDGRFALLAFPGPVEARAELRTSSDSGVENGELTSVSSALELTISVGVLAPRIVRTEPAAGAVNVRAISAIEVFFSEPVLRTSVPPNAISVTRGGIPVEGSQSLRPDGRSLAFFPRVALHNNALHQVTVSPAITDAGGESLTGTLQFSFTTELEREGPNGAARLISYAPGSELSPCEGMYGFTDQHTCVVGGLGVADPNATVILVNEETGATQTTDSNSDGTFTTFIRGDAEDLLSAVLVNRNGTRVVVPLELQRFDDGSFALYSSGGIVEGPSPFPGGAPLELVVEPGTIPRRGVFKLVGRPLSELGPITGGAQPSDGAILFGASLSYEGDATTKPIDVRFPVRGSDVNLSESALAQSGYLLARVRHVTVEGEDLTTYEVLDRMEYEGGALATHSYPMLGLLAPIAAPRSLLNLELVMLRLLFPPPAMTGFVVACPVEDQVSDCDALLGVFPDQARPVLDPNLIPATGRRLAGALVFASPAQGTSTPRAPAVMSAGQLVSVADSRGVYSIALPFSSTLTYVARAVHPDFPGQQASSMPIPGRDFGASTQVHLVFDTGSGNGPVVPRANIAHTPVRPQPWTSNSDPQDQPEPNERALVTVSVTPPDANIVVTLAVQDVAPLSNLPVSLNDVVITALSGDAARRSFTVTCSREALVRLRARATLDGRSSVAVEPIYFGGTPQPLPDVLASSEPSNGRRPAVERTWPPNNGTLRAGAPIIVELSEPISRLILEDPTPIRLELVETSMINEELPTESPEPPALTLSADQRRLEITYSRVLPGTKYSLSLSTSIVDLENNPLDSDPTTADPEGYTLTFNTSTEQSAALKGLGLGGGAVVHGAFAYVLDRTAGLIRVYDISTPEFPRHVHSEALPGGYPRDLTLIRDYSYVRPTGERSQFPCDANYGERAWSTGFHRCTNVATGCAGLDRTLLAVVGGTTNPLASLTSGNGSSGQYLRIFDITNGPTDMIVRSTSPVSIDPTSALGHLVWSPPQLAYLNRSSGPSTIELVDLQTHIFGRDLTAGQLETMPEPGVVTGDDKNQDGDYTDPDDLLPMPTHAVGGIVDEGYAGLKRRVSVFGTNQQINDFAFFGIDSFVGSILSPGVLSTTGGVPASPTSEEPLPTVPVPAAYQTLSSGELYGPNLPRNIAAFDQFGPGAELQAVAYFPLQRIRLRGANERDQAQAGAIEIVNLVIVGAQRGSDNLLFLLDVTDTPPTLIGDPAGIRLPNSSGRIESSTGRIEKIERDILLSGVIRVSTEDDVVLLDIDRLTMSSPPNGEHPAVTGVISGVGSSHHANGATNFGVHVLSDTERVAFTGPELFLVSFPEEQTLVSPRTWIAESDERQRKQLMDGIFRKVTTENALRVSRFQASAGLASELDPPSPLTHFYVLMYAPGGAGEDLNLMVEVLNDAGHPLAERGPGFAPVRAATRDTLHRQGIISTRTAPTQIRPLHALRLSNEPSSAYYNVYLSDPIAVVYQKVTDTELDTLRTVGSSGLRREIFHSGDGMRISLDHAFVARNEDGRFDNDNVLADFASDVVNQEVVLGSALTTSSYPAHRILGPNPAPIVGPVTAPATGGVVALNNNEVRTTGVDLVLPSPQMPIAVVRTYVGQDLNHGPFGRGFDFNYNQRIVELKPELFPEGKEIEIFLRGSAELDTKAGPKDLIFHNGAGAMIFYDHLDGQCRPGTLAGLYAQDPLLAPLSADIVDCYQPEPGIFDAMVRMRDGNFLRVTPDGIFYFYSPTGRMVSMFHRYRRNHHLLHYTNKGELRRIEDASIPETPRYVDFIYFRKNTSELEAIDVGTTVPQLDGRVHSLRDNFGRVVSFNYDDDTHLESVEGVAVKGPDGVTIGRKKTEYRWRNNLLIGVYDGSVGGEPTAAATLDANGVAVGSTGVRGSTTITRTGANTSAAVAGGGASIGITRPADGTLAQVTLSPFGMPEKITYTGSNGKVEETTIRYAPGQRYIPESITQKRGNSDHYTYDFSNPNLRSRGNLLSIVRRPSSISPGATYTYSIPRESYDPRYNLRVGPARDFDNNLITVSLINDAKSVGSVSYVGASGPAITETFDVDGMWGQLEGHTSVDGTVVEFDYNDKRFPEIRRDGELASTLSYDDSIGSQLGNPTSVSIGAHRSVSFSYDDLGREIRAQRGLNWTETTRDKNGHIEKLREQVDDDGTTYEESRKYDQRGFMTERVQLSLETNGALGAPLRWKYDPDALGRLGMMTTPDLKTTSYSYDLRDRLQQVRSGDQVESYEYDESGNLTRRIAGEAPGTTLEERRYDSLDRPYWIRDPIAPSETTIGYTGNGHVLSMNVEDTAARRVVRSFAVTSFDGVGRPLSWTEGGAGYSATHNGLTTTQTNPLFATETRTRYASGREATRSLPGVYSQTSHWGAEGDLLHVERREGNLGVDYGARFTYSPVEGYLETIRDSGSLRRMSFANRADGASVSETIYPLESGSGLSKTIRRSALGEHLGTTSAEGVRNYVDFDEQRRIGHTGPELPGGRRYTYDDAGRLKTVTYPDGSTETISSFDLVGNPMRIERGDLTVIPVYDLRRRLQSNTVTFAGQPTFVEHYGYDALDRLVSASGPAASVGFGYDLLGTRTTRTLAVSSAGPAFAWDVVPDGAGAPHVTNYPNRYPVTSAREPHGRLLSVDTPEGSIVGSMSYQATASQPTTVVLGEQGLQRLDDIDPRRRLLRRRYVRGGRTIADIRYEYDNADRESTRQYMHRGGRADLYSYDDDSRLEHAELAARPSAGESSAPAWSVAAPWRAGAYGRTYNYDNLEGRDRLTSTARRQWLFEPPPPVAADFGTADSSGHVGLVDGLTRPTDSLGNVLRAHLESGDATLEYDGFSRLTRVTRADRSTISYQYRADGPLVRRTVACASGSSVGCVSSDRVYIYDGLNLLEEYEVVSSARRELMARYFYADEGDVPIAADLRRTRQDVLQRYFYVSDRMGSIMGVLDAEGRWVERVSYDPWGRPAIEGADVTAPEVSAIRSDTNGDLLVAFTEPILPPVPSNSGAGIVSALAALQGMFVFVEAGDLVDAEQVEIDESVTAYPRGTVVRVTPPFTLTASSQYDLRVLDGAVADSWTHSNIERTIHFTFQPNTEVWTNPTPPPPPSAQLERSSIGNSVLFQSHLYDYDADLLHMRARAFDPYTGSFLQRDPFGYEDSVNLYAGLAWDPINNRDPTGAWVHVAIGAGVGVLFGVGVEGLSQYLRGELDVRRLIAAGAGGGLAGALTAVTFGAGGIAGSIGISHLAAGGTIGVASASTQALIRNDRYTGTQALTDFMVGAATLGFGESLRRAINPNAGVINAIADDLVDGGEYAIANPKKTLALVEEHIGSSNPSVGKPNPINPSSRTDNCIAGVCAVVRNKLAKTFLGSADDVEREFGSVARDRTISRVAALEYIQDATGLTASARPKPFMDAKAPVGHYVVFAGREHVVYGRILPGGSRFLYDPQIGARISWGDLIERYGAGIPYLLE